MILGFSVIVCTIVIDQWVKYWIVNQLPLYGAQSLWPSVVGLTHVRNQGASWGILQGQQGFFIVITCVAVAYLSYLLYQRRHQAWYVRLAFGLLIGGAFGNLIDRVLQGYVVDMFELEFMQFPIFNIADTALTLGVVLLAVLIWLDKEYSEEQK